VLEAIGLAVVFIYLILASLFGLHPAVGDHVVAAAVVPGGGARVMGTRGRST
jgi:hypothetical protein